MFLIDKTVKEEYKESRIPWGFTIFWASWEGRMSEENYYRLGFGRGYDQGIMGKPMTYGRRGSNFPTPFAWIRYRAGCEEGHDAGCRDGLIIEALYA